MMTRWEGGKFKLSNFPGLEIRKFLVLKLESLNLPPSQRVKMGIFRKFLEAVTDPKFTP